MVYYKKIKYIFLFVFFFLFLFSIKVEGYSTENTYSYTYDDSGNIISMTYNYTHHATNAVYTNSFTVTQEFFSDDFYPYWSLWVANDGTPLLVATKDGQPNLFMNYANSYYYFTAFDENGNSSATVSYTLYIYSYDFSTESWSLYTSGYNRPMYPYVYPSGYLTSYYQDVTMGSNYAHRYSIIYANIYFNDPCIAQISDDYLLIDLEGLYDDFTYEDSNGKYASVTDTVISTMGLSVTCKNDNTVVYSATTSLIDEYFYTEDGSIIGYLLIPLSDLNLTSGYTYEFVFYDMGYYVVQPPNVTYGSYNFYSICTDYYEFTYGFGTVIGDEDSEDDKWNNLISSLTGSNEEVKNAIDNQTSAIENQTNAIESQTEQQKEQYDEFTNTDISDDDDSTINSTMSDLSSSTDNIDDTDYTNLFSYLFEKFYSVVDDSSYESVSTITIYLPFIENKNKGITLSSDILENLLGDLKTIVNVFYYFVFGMYIFRFAYGLIKKIKSGDILNGYSNNDEVITSTML